MNTTSRELAMGQRTGEIQLELGTEGNQIFSALLGRLSLYLLTLYILFGVNDPFSASIRDVDELVTENIANQIVFLILFTTSMLSLVAKRIEVLNIIKKEKWLSLFLLWAFLTVFWSDFAIISFKRLVQIYIVFFVCLAGLLNMKSFPELLKVLKSILYVYISLCMLSVILFPWATDPISGTWQGLADGKNELGQVALICILASFFSFKTGLSRSRFLDLLMLFVSLVLLAGARSMTPTLTLVMLITLAGLWFVNNLFEKKLATGKWFLVIVGVATVGAVVIVTFFGTDLYAQLFALLGKDSTFTGRTHLWSDILSEANKHLIAGGGFGGFWVVDSPAVLTLYQDYPWLPRQAHMGYLDVLNDTGLVGLSLLVVMSGVFFYHANKLKHVQIWVLLFMMVIFVNFQETTFFKPKKLIFLTFIFSYLAVYVQFVKQKTFS